MALSYESSSWLSFLGYGWLNPLVVTGLARQVKLEDTATLAKADDTAANAHHLLTNLHQQEHAGKSHPLLRAVVLTFRRPLVIMEVLQVADHFLGLLGPLLLQQVLIFQEAQQKGEHDLPHGQVVKGLSAVVLLIIHGLFTIFYSSQLKFLQARVSLRVGSALRGTVLYRCVRGSGAPSPRRSATGRKGGDKRQGSAQAPAVYNVISFDVGPNVEIIWIVLAVWIFPIQFISTMAVLFSQIQGAVFPGLAVIIAAKLFNGVLLTMDGRLRHRQLAAKDARLGSCAESFSSIRTLHMLAWARPFEKQIMAARSTELRVAQQRLWMQKMVAALDYSLSAIVTLVTLGFYVSGHPGDLKASVALPIIGLVSSLVGPFGQFPIWANHYFIWRSAYDRVNNYMGLGGQAHQGSEPIVEGGADGGTDGGIDGDKGGDVAALRTCTLSWVESQPTDICTSSHKDTTDELAAGAAQPGHISTTASKFSLKDLDIRIRGGDVVVLCGAQGEGKSSYLHGLLGEMIVEGGELRSPALLRLAAEEAQGAAGGLLPPSTSEVRQEFVDKAELPLNPNSVPYAAQSVTLFAGTIRSNVIFGTRYNSELYGRVLKACALEADLATMPSGDLTEIDLGGATLSGGQRARVGLARAAYRAALAMAESIAAGPGGVAPLVLLDDPFCALDRGVAREVCRELFAAPGGLLAGCAVVVAAADPWWVQDLPQEQQGDSLRLVVLRSGQVVASGVPSELHGLELQELSGLSRDTGSAPLLQMPHPCSMQDDEMENQGVSYAQKPVPDVTGSKLAEAPIKTQQQNITSVTDEEHREEGHVKWATYKGYFMAVGPGVLLVTFLSIASIMTFWTFCSLWIAYWTSEEKESTFMYSWLKHFSTEPPEDPSQLFTVYAYLVLAFTLSNFAGHALEIIGGIRAARSIFSKSLRGTFRRPFYWWDANPTGRVLNRFSSDVEVMDLAVTNILGIILGAVLYFLGHSIVLAITNLSTLLLLPIIALGMEFYARYYRTTIREVQRILLVSTSSVYQGMVEVIVGKVTIRAFAESRQMLCRCIDGLDDLQRADFAKTAIGLWIGLRMALIGFVLSTYTLLQPVLQYLGFVSPRSAALVGFSIEYSKGMVGIIQQFIMNYSDLEMQLISIERLREYAGTGEIEVAQACGQQRSDQLVITSADLQLEQVRVTYRSGLPPALMDVSVRFRSGEATAIMGRTGAGKSSLLLSILQLVPYEGRITLGGHLLSALAPEEVRKTLVGVVPQQPMIFAGSLRWNLDPEGCHTDSDLWAALQAVRLQEVCDGPQKLGAICIANGEAGGLQLSQGQQQLLCAARTLLRKPRVVLLDEVTASLPAENAMTVLSTLVQQYKSEGAAVLVVTHQQEVLSCCNRVVSVAGGRVVGVRCLTGQEEVN